MRAGVLPLPALAVVAVALVLAAACGGGGSAGGMAAAGTPSITVEIDDVAGRAKLAELGSGLSAIYSDQMDRGDPQEATHVRVRLLGAGGNVAMEKVAPLRRKAEPPYWVEVDSRRITLEQLPFGEDFTLRVELGRDYGFSRLRIKDTVYYRGEVSGLTVTAHGVFQGGRLMDTITIPVKLNIDPAADYLYLQGYADYRAVPALDLPALDPTYLPKKPIAVADTIGAFSTTYSASCMVQGPYEGPLPHFFFLPRIDQQVQGLLVSVNAGPPHYVALLAVVTRDDILAGKPVLADWETTFGGGLVASYLMYRKGHFSIEDPSLYPPALERFRRLLALLEERIRAYGSPGPAIELTSEEVVAYKIRSGILRLSRTSDPKGEMRSPNLIANGLFAMLARDPFEGINAAFVSKGRPVTIKRDGYAPLQVVDVQAVELAGAANIMEGQCNAQAFFDHFDRIVP